MPYIEIRRHFAFCVKIRKLNNNNSNNKYIETHILTQAHNLLSNRSIYKLSIYRNMRFYHMKILYKNSLFLSCCWLCDKQFGPVRVVLSNYSELFMYGIFELLYAWFPSTTTFDHLYCFYDDSVWMLQVHSEAKSLNQTAFECNNFVQSWLVLLFRG